MAKRAAKPRFPRSVRTREDIVDFFAHLYLVDRTSFHPDDRFYDEERGEVAYVDRSGRPTYTTDEARLRDRLMAEAWDVAEAEGLDIYEIGLWTGALVGAGGEPETAEGPAPAWLRRALAPWVEREGALRTRQR